MLKPALLNTASEVTIALCSGFSRRLRKPLLLSAAIGLALPGPAFTAPQGGVVIDGQVSIAQNGPTTTINQTTEKGVIEWQAFSIEGGEAVSFNQPDAQSVTLNRVTGGNLSEIYGSLTSNGRIILINPKGIVFGEGAQIDVGGLVATTSDIANEDFMAGRLNFDRPGDPDASIVNRGSITAADAGLVAFVAPHVKNSGTIRANLGRVEMAAGTKFTIDLYGDDLISFVVDAQVVEVANDENGDPVAALVEVDGGIFAEGGSIELSAQAARSLIDNVIIADGTLVARSATQTGGKISLRGGSHGSVQATGMFDVSGVSGGSIKASGEQVFADGAFIANAMGASVGDVISDAAIRSLALDPQSVDVDVQPPYWPGAGGEISIEGENWVSVGGALSANGAVGGKVSIESGQGLSIAGSVAATGAMGGGGDIDINSAGNALVFSGAEIDASGLVGGTITQTAQTQITTSGQYSVRGETGAGGSLDMTAPVTKLLTAEIDASGGADGGIVRIGGEYQGGKNLDADEIANAQVTIGSSGTAINASSRGDVGAGGEVIIWSDQETIFLGEVTARPGAQIGEGGFVEVSSAGDLSFNAHIETGVGSRKGVVLLDPKNLAIVDDSFDGLALILGFNYDGAPSGLQNVTDEPIGGFSDLLGSSVSLDGNRLAIGADAADGFDNANSSSGEVFLFSFSDAEFSNPVLEATIGDGYTGGKNINVAQLDVSDRFGTDVSLDGNRLAVGALGDDGAADNIGTAGAVYLFSFSDAEFSGGTLEATIGADYSGAKNFDVTALAAGDSFGRSVSLDGNRLAVSASGDDGFTNGLSSAGAVYLFSFSDAVFSNPTLEATIGADYTGGKNLDVTAIDGGDIFGTDVSLDGTQLAVGAERDDGFGDARTFAGAVYLFTFSDLAFNNPTLQGQIGSGYTGAHSFDLTTADVNDFGGNSVSLDNGRLAVGWQRGDGAGNAVLDSGEVYLFSFDDATFLNPTLEATLGADFASGKDLDVPNIGSSDRFGTDISLDGNRLAVGVTLDDGADDEFGSAGAVYLFTFTDSDFNGADTALLIGANYGSAVGVETLSTLANADSIAQTDNFGTSISLDGNRLAVGSSLADSSDGSTSDTGAVTLFSFQDEFYSSPTLDAIIGSGYTGGKNIDLALDSNDQFGDSVSLDGNRLAVGARFDDGFNNSSLDSGAVYLFSFSDDAFNSGVLEATAGVGYTSGKDIDVTLLDASDRFGAGVSLDGTRLAVGAEAGNGFNNTDGNFLGEVHLFTFSDSSFSSGTLVGTIGANYSGARSLDLAASGFGTEFGAELSLDGDMLAIGAARGHGVTGNDTGDVYLVSFADSTFLTPTLVGRIGAGWSGLGKDLNFTLDNFDTFGSSVSLDGDQLAIGAEQDDGSGNSLINSGAVYIFDISGAPVLTQTLGVGYGTNVDNLTGDDLFGSAVALDGDRLAIGSIRDDGARNTLTDSGAVYLYNFGNNISVPAATFGNDPSGTSYVTVGTLTALLDSGNNVTLQANNDLTLATDLTVDNPSGDGGDITFQAGRSVYLNGSITSDNGDVTIVANETLANGVVDAQRDAGAAVLRMSSSAGIFAGTGAVRLTLADGTGKTNSASGDLTTQSVDAGSVIVENLGSSGGDVIVNGDITTLTATGGTPIIVASSSGNFINNTSGSPSLQPGAGRFLVYAQSPFDNTPGANLSGNPYYNTSYNPASPDLAGVTGSRFVYTLAPTLTVTANNASRDYGDADPSFSSVISGFINGDASSNVSGAASFSTTATSSSNVGAYTITPSIGSLASDYNYGFTFANGTLTIDPASLVITAGSASREYGDLNPSFGFSASGLKNGESEAVLSGINVGTSATSASNVGSYGTVASGGPGNSNYTITSYVDGVLTVTPATLTVTANDASRDYGDANPAFGATITGFKLSDNAGNALTGAASLTTTATPTTSVGSSPVAITAGLGSLASNNGNYVFSFVDGALTIDPASLVITAGSASREYGDLNPSFGFSASGLKNGESEAVLSGISVGTSATSASNVGSYGTVASGGPGNSNYTITSYVDGVLTVTPATLTVTANDASREYGDANPAFGATITGFKLSDNAGNALTGAASLTTTATPTTSVGSSPVAITAGLGSLASNNGNYVFSFVDGALTIDPASLVITAGSASREYGDLNPSFGFSASGLKNGESEAVLSGISVGTSATSASNVGSYGTVASGGPGNSNYTITSYVDGVLTVTPATLTVTANDASREYGDANPAFGATITGFKLSDNAGNALTGAASLTTTATPTTSVGSSPVAITAGLGSLASNNGNYVFSFVDGALTIDPASLVITAGSASREYGDLNPSFGFSASGLKNGESEAVLSGISVGTSATSASNVGSYGTVASGGPGNSNYTITSYVDGVLTVTPATLTVTANDASREYGDANPAFGATITGFKLSDNAGNALTGAASLTTTATPTTSVGSSPVAITAGLGSLASNNGNYVFSFVDGALTIDPASLVITAGSASREYGDLNPSFGFSASGLKNGESEAVLSGISVGTSATSASNVGSYGTVASGGPGNSNYTITSYVDGVLTVTPATLTVTANDASREYGDANPAFGATITGFKLSDNAGNALTGAASLTTTATPTTSVGSSPVAITAGLGSLASNNGNYVFSFVDGALTIDPASLVITAGSASREYGDLNPSFGFSASGLKNGESEAVLSGISVGTSATSASNVGSYGTVASGGPGNSNYTITSYVDGVLTVTPAPIVVSVDDATKVTGQPLPVFTATLSGLKLSDDASVFTGLSFSTTATASSPVGEYSISSTGGIATNYVIVSRSDGTLTVAGGVDPNNILGKTDVNSGQIETQDTGSENAPGAAAEIDGGLIDEAGTLSEEEREAFRLLCIQNIEDACRQIQS